MSRRGIWIGRTSGDRARLLGALGLAGALGAGLTSPSRGQRSPTTSLYTASGTHYSAVSGSVEELFPRGASASAQGSSPALAIDVVQPTGAAERLLVPGTDDPASELEPILIWDEGSSSLLALWTSRSPDGARLFLAALGIDGWSDVTVITPEALSVAGAPEVLVVRDSDERVIVHLVFAREGDGHTYYAAVVLHRGRYVGWTPVLPLAAFDDHAAETVAASSVGLQPSIRPGSDQRSAVLGLFRAETGHVLSLRSRILPMALVSFAEEARNHLIGVGTWHRSTSELASTLATHLAELGSVAHPAAITYLSRQASSFVVEHAESFASLHELGDALRRHLILQGASLLNQEFGPEPASCSLAEVGPDLGQQAVPAPHQLEICLVTVRSLPPIGDGARIRVSADGGRLLLAWQTEDALYFRLSQDSGWGDERWVPLGSEDPEVVIDSLLR